MPIKRKKLNTGAAKGSNPTSQANRVAKRVEAGGVKHPPKHVVNRTQAHSNIRTAEVIVPFRCRNLAQVVESIVEYALSQSWISPEAVTGTTIPSAKELYYGLYDDLLNAMRPAPSHYLTSKTVPIWYRELFEAILPGSQSDPGESTFGYKWSGIPQEDQTNMSHVYERPLTPEHNYSHHDVSGSDVDGFLILDHLTPIPEHQKAKEAVTQFFANCIGIGHKPWLGGKTIFLEDTSVFAFTMDVGNVVLDHTTDQVAIVAHEKEIRFPWLAALQLVDSRDTYDRYPSHVEKVTGLRGVSLGHRLIRMYTGYQGLKDRIHFKLVDLSEFEVMFVSLINGAEMKRLQSTEQRTETKLFEGGNFQYLRALINFCWMNQHSSTRSVISGVKPNAGSPLKFGTRFFNSLARVLDRINIPSIIAENIRMLHASELSIKKGERVVSNDYYYPVPVWYYEADRIDLTTEIIPTGWINVPLAHDPTGETNKVVSDRTAYNYVNTPGNGMKDYVDEFSIKMSELSAHMKTVPITKHMEAQVGAQLMLMDTSHPVVFTEGGEVCIPLDKAMRGGHMKEVNTNVYKQLQKIIEHRDKAIREKSLFHKYLDEERQKKPRSQRAPALLSATNIQLPSNGNFDIFKQMVLPKTFVKMSGSTNNLSALISQYKIRDVHRAASSAIIPQIEILNSMFVHARVRGSSEKNDTELVQVLDKKSKLGLGSANAVGYSNVGMTGKLLGGGSAAIMADQIVGMNTYTSLVNDVGGWVIDIIDSMTGTTFQQRSAKRKARRANRRA